MKPKSPLPWKRQLLPDGQFEFQDANGEQVFDDDACPSNDTMFILHACNSHPKLVDCMKTFIEHDAYNPSAIAAEILLKELGEL